MRLLGVNVYVLLFNLIPAFPLDGGRVLRALLASRMGLVRATRIAGTSGRCFAVAVGRAAGSSRRQPLLMLVAFFIFLGAGSEASAVATRLAGRGLHGLADDGDRVPDHSGPCHARSRPWTCCWRASSASFRWWTTWAGPKGSSPATT